MTKRLTSKASRTGLIEGSVQREKRKEYIRLNCSQVSPAGLSGQQW